MNNSATNLRNNDMKATPQRMAIVEKLSVHGHLSIDELYGYIKKDFPSLSLATLYKNIHAMNQKKFTQEVKLPNQKSVYELTKDEHIHLTCEKCGKIEDLTIDTQMLCDNLSCKNTYTNTKITSLVIQGLCQECS